MLSAEQKQSIDATLISTYWEFIFNDPACVPTSLISTLAAKLPHIAVDSWIKRLSWGGVFVNGEAPKEDIQLPFPCRIEYYEPRFNFEDPYSYFPRFDPHSIIFEDEDLLCMVKPTGLPAMPGREQEQICAKGYLERYISDKYGADARSIHLPSRLDMSTMGLMVVSKNPALHNVLQRCFETRRVEKFYLLATSSGVTYDKELQVDLPIGRDPDHPILRKPRSLVEGGKPALTHFFILDKLPSENNALPKTLLCAKPHTGRTHQIRVHAAYSGFPITGDRFYMGGDATTLHLLSARIKLPHPRTKAPLDITIPETMLPSWVSRPAFEALKLL